MSRTRPPLLVFFGRHKCATRYITGILDACAKTLGVGFMNGAIPEPRSLDWTFRHLPPQIGIIRASPYPSTIRAVLDRYEIPFRGFHVYRDPRDMVVSGYFSHRHSHPERWIFQKTHFARLRALDAEQGLKCEVDYTGWLELDDLAAWDRNDPRIAEVKFEDLTAHPLEFFARFFRDAGFEPAEETLAEILARHRFENLSGGRKPGEQDVTSHYRKGVPGDWKNHLKGETLTYFTAKYGPLVDALGYPA